MGGISNVVQRSETDQDGLAGIRSETDQDGLAGMPIDIFTLSGQKAKSMVLIKSR